MADISFFGKIDMGIVFYVFEHAEIEFDINFKIQNGGHDVFEKIDMKQQKRINNKFKLLTGTHSAGLLRPAPMPQKTSYTTL